MSTAKPVCYFIFGNDVARSAQSVKAIETRFLAKQDNLTDLVHYDVEETSLETIKQTILTVPFFTSHRLFILKHACSAPKATQEALIKLIGQLSPATFVVFYETKPCDKRLTLYNWLSKNAKVQESTMPTGTLLVKRIHESGAAMGITLEPAAVNWLADVYGTDSLRLALEIKKLVSYCASGQRTKITLHDVTLLCFKASDESFFRLSDSLRQGDLRQTVQLYRALITKDDPMLLAATLVSQIRSAAKLFLGLKQGLSQPALLTSKTKLNPYVVKLTLPLAKSLNKRQLQEAYDSFIWFDASVKNGMVESRLGILLLILRLHDNLNRRVG